MATTGDMTAAMAVAAARRAKITKEILSIMEPIECPQCGKGKLVSLFSSGTTNWICTQ